MKKRILTPLFFLLCISAFSQQLNYSVNGVYFHSIQQKKLTSAQFVSDLVPECQPDWIKHCVSIGISGTCNGKTVIMLGTSDTLSVEQKNMLSGVDLGTEISVSINFNYSRMLYTMTLIPDIEAEFMNGYTQLSTYLYENAVKKIGDTVSSQLQWLIIKFTVTETGEINNATITGTSGDIKIDLLLLDAINNMPKWKPAQNSNGKKVKQEFEFTIGTSRQGC